MQQQQQQQQNVVETLWKNKTNWFVKVKKPNQENITFTKATDTKAYWFSFVRHSKVSQQESILNILILSFPNSFPILIIFLFSLIFSGLLLWWRIIKSVVGPFTCLLIHSVVFFPPSYKRVNERLNVAPTGRHVKRVEGWNWNAVAAQESLRPLPSQPKRLKLSNDSSQ